MGTLVPPWYKAAETSQTGLLVAAFFFGASTAVAVFDSTKAGRQSFRSWRRSNRANLYIAMLWAVIATSAIASLCSWLFLLGKIPPSIWYFVGMLFAWVTQIQCLMQILANRLSLILYNPVKERRLKVGLLIAVGLINISVFCIWIPARLQISRTFISLNNIWDRAEKAIFAVIDVALNTYFMWLVKSKLVAGGLTEYNVLYKYNLVMVCLSISLDILLIGLMSLPDDAVYVQVHPLVYLAKLSIEMNMAELLGKAVRKSTATRSALPSTDIYHPQLGMVAFDREWLGSAKDIIMPRALSGGGGDNSQMTGFNMDILNQSSSRREERGSSSAQEDVDRWQSQREVNRGRSRVRSVHEADRKDSAASEINV